LHVDRKGAFGFTLEPKKVPKPLELGCREKVIEQGFGEGNDAALVEAEE
jgi:hypothetical protein